MIVSSVQRRMSDCVYMVIHFTSQASSRASSKFDDNHNTTNRCDDDDEGKRRRKISVHSNNFDEEKIMFGISE
jgi:hypothetical protein